MGNGATEESRRFAGKRKQEIWIAEREVEIVADKKEEVRSLGTELKALEKAVSAGFPLDAGQNDGIVNTSAHGAAQQERGHHHHHPHMSPDDFQRGQLKQWYWTHLASHAGIDVDAFERQWWGQECVYIDAEKGVCVDDAGR